MQLGSTMTVFLLVVSSIVFGGKAFAQQSSEEIELSQCAVESPFNSALIQFTYVDWQSNQYFYSAVYNHRYSLRKEVLVVRYDRYGNVVLREVVKRQAPMVDTLRGVRTYGSFRPREVDRFNEVLALAEPEFQIHYQNSIGLRVQCQ